MSKRPWLIAALACAALCAIPLVVLLVLSGGDQRRATPALPASSPGPSVADPPAAVLGEVAGGESDESIDAAVEREEGVGGAVTGPDGKPVAGAMVGCVDDDDPTLSGRTDADGRFLLPARAAGCSAVAHHRDHEPSREQVLTAGEDNALALREAGGIDGQVLDDGGRPLDAFTVAIESFVPADGKSMGKRGTRHPFAEAAGRFELTGLQSGRYVLTVTAPDRPPVQSDSLEVEPGAVSRVRITLPLGGILSGIVTDRDSGAPIVGAKVSLDLATTTGANGVAPTVSDEEGFYELVGVPVGPFSIRVDAPGFAARVVAGITGPRNPRGDWAVQKDVDLSPAEGSVTEYTGIGAMLAATPQGIMIGMVIPGGPAESAGVQKKDVVARIDGEEVRELTVPQAAQRLRGPAGTDVRLTLERGDQTLDVIVTRQTFTR